MPRTKTFAPYDTADYIKTDAQVGAYLEAVAEQNDPALLAKAFATVARARTMGQRSRDAGVTRVG